jgi:hypothetical protein
MILKQELIARSGFSVSGVEKRLMVRNIKPIFKGIINGHNKSDMTILFLNLLSNL